MTSRERASSGHDIPGFSWTRIPKAASGMAEHEGLSQVSKETPARFEPAGARRLILIFPKSHALAHDVNGRKEKFLEQRRRAALKQRSAVGLSVPPAATSPSPYRTLQWREARETRA